MGAIQSSILGLIGSVGKLTKTVGSMRQDREQAATGTKQSTKPTIQEAARKVAKQSADGEIQGKTVQRRRFSEYLAKMPISLGSETRKIGELPPEMQKQIGATYNKSQRKKIMDAMDKEANNGKR